MKTLEKIVISPKKINNNKSFQIIIFEGKKNSKNVFNGKILGKTLTEWLKLSCAGYPTKIVESKGNLLSQVNSVVESQFDYSILLMNSTPLLTSEDIKNIVEYASTKDVCLCKLPCGYVIKNACVKDISNCFVDSVYTINIENFYVVESKKQYEYALNVFKNRINKFHVNNGVEIVDSVTTYIEPDVDIGKGTVICPGNILKGNTIIGNNVILKENNIISHSKIENNSCISGSTLENSRVGKNVYIASYSTVKNCFIDDDCLIESGSHLSNVKLHKNSKLKPNTVMGEDDDSSSGTR